MDPPRQPGWKDAPPPSAIAWLDTDKANILKESFLNPAHSTQSPAEASTIKPATYLGYAIIKKPAAAMPAAEKTPLIPEPKGTRDEQYAAADAVEDLYNRDAEDSESLPAYFD